MKKLKELRCDFCSKVFNRYESAIKAKVTEDNFCTYECFNNFRKSKTLNQDFFEIIDTEEKSYWLGFLYADGHVSKPSRKQKNVTLGLAPKDSNHVKKFAKIFNANYGIYSRGKNDPFKIFLCTITSEKMWKDLYNNGFSNNKTTVDSDETMNFVPDNLFHHFIRGFFDGDGSISMGKKGSIIFNIVGVKSVLERIKKYLLKKCLINDVNIFPKKNIKYVSVLEWSGIFQLNKIYNVLYKDATVYLERKKERFEIANKRIEKINKNKTSKYRGVCYTGYSYTSTIYNNKKLIQLGCYKNEEEAAKAYDNALIELGKPLYKLNFPLNVKKEG